VFYDWAVYGGWIGGNRNHAESGERITQVKKYYPGVQVLGVSALYWAITGKEKAANECAVLALRCQQSAEIAETFKTGNKPHVS
jgi:hypothetical protein